MPRSADPAPVRHVRTLFDLSPAETAALVRHALELKRERRQGVDQRRLPGRVLGLVFEKPSLRTRVSFEAGMAHLGGTTVYLAGQDVGLGSREPIGDFARVMSGYVDAIAIRTFSQSRVEELARLARCPVINALSDSDHPCQALGDAATLLERFGELRGLKVAFIGDANNVSRSLATAAAYLGMEFVLAAPAGYEFPREFLARHDGLPGTIRQDSDPARAAAGANAVYTDVWASMGQEAEAAARRAAFAPYQVTEALMALAKPEAIFLHCLPARRGEEVAAAVIDGPSSAIAEQAEFRMHAQKALLLKLLERP